MPNDFIDFVSTDPFCLVDRVTPCNEVPKPCPQTLDEAPDAYLANTDAVLAFN